MANNLTDETHQLLVTNVGDGRQGSYIDFDYAVINSTVDPNAAVTGNSTGTNITASTSISASSSATGAASQISGSTIQKGGSNAGPIAGGVVGGVAGLAIIGLLAWFFLRRRQNNNQRHYMEPSAEPVNLSGDEVKPYPHGSSEDAYAETGAGTGAFAGWRGNSTNVTSPSARETDHSSTPFLTAVPPPPASNATSYPRSVAPPSSADNASPVEETSAYVNPFTGTGGPRSYADNQSPAASAMSTGTAPDSTSGSDPTTSSTTPPPRAPKTAGVALPFTARPPTALSANSSSFSSPNRMQREGREFDMGPAIPPAEHGEGYHPPLPPDYQQAIEPLPGQHPAPPPGGQPPSR